MVGLSIAALCLMLGAAPVRWLSRVRKGTLLLDVADTGPGNLVPTFTWQAGAAEGSSAVSAVASRPNPAEITMDDSCPSDIFEGAMPDLRDPALPHLIQDGYSLNRTARHVEVFVLENEAASVVITPQWGGKIWDFALKQPGTANTSLLFKNPLHQPVNSGVLKAYTAGGIEWNWSPGVIGHTVFTDSPVHLAKVATSQGDIVRVYEFDRFNESVWQVDIFLNGTTLWVHPKVRNPNDHDMLGYWWTNAGVPTTTPNGVCKPRTGLAYGAQGSRAITPTQFVVNNAGGKLNMAKWPRFTQTCCHGDQNVDQGAVFPDLSYLAHHMTGPCLLDARKLLGF